ncbi:SDR family NAD(P)-dependent oxidoreductase [Magnetovibrio sp.]|uniref:SDR family NAD(P)-dependent oxidoreductase n=1 Tax=Magnetovibrio sp. TaxID=2024836 RepID=UPI002F950AC4
MKDPKSILITGASSGIGAALALEYAAPGVHLTLTGRDAARLEDVQRDCVDKGASVRAKVLSVTDRAAMAAFIGETDRLQPLDLVIANAGISGGSGGNGESEEQARAIFDVNFTGVLNTIWPAIDAMKSRKRGQIAMVSSIAGMTPLPGAPAYSASKVAVKAYAEALNGALRPEGIVVTAICPGFVESRITAKNNFPMPLFMDAPKAARRIRKGLSKGRISVFFPRRLAAVTWAIGMLPPCWRVWILSRAPKKG